MATLEIAHSVPAPNAIEVFCSYSHKDDLLREELETHLSILQADGVINNWCDHAIPAGKEWQGQIDEHLNSAQIILLLISPDFLASKYCREVEIKRALERHRAGEATVIAILLRDVDWDGSPVSQLQALPKGARAVTNWPNRDQAFKDVTIGIRKVAVELRKKRPIAGAGVVPPAEVGGRSPAVTVAPPAEVEAGAKPQARPKTSERLLWKYIAIGIIAAIVLAGLAYFVAEKLGQPRYYGGIDLGSKGTKAELFLLDNNDDLCCDPKNTKLVSSMKDGQFTSDGIQDATDKVKQQIKAMRAEAEKDRIQVQYFIVGSSGVAKAKNKNALAASVKAATGIDMDFIDAKREGYFGLLSTMPSIPKDKLFVSSYVDIGSGNTKFGCVVGGLDLADYQGGEIEYGSVSARILGTEKNPKDKKAGIDEVMEEVGQHYYQESSSAPWLQSVTEIYWTGGAAWATATFMHPDKALEPTVKIARSDLDTFLARLRDGSWNQKPLPYSFPKDMPSATQEAIRKAAEKDWYGGDGKDGVMKVFAGEDLYAGISIMKTILGYSNASATVTFVRDGGKFLHGFATEKYHNRASENAQPGK
jgi:TIR domain-containing protein